MNKLGIPAEGIHFCYRCFEFHKHTVEVNEGGNTVDVKLTCTDCGHSLTYFDDKDTFFEYDSDTKPA